MLKIDIYHHTECWGVQTMGIIPQNFSSLGFAVSEELGNKQTDSLTDWCFDGVIEM